MRVRPLLLVLALCAACSPSEQQARKQAQDALARGDRGAAIAAIEALERAGADDADRRLEQADLWIRAGEAPRAVWLLEDALARFPQRHDLRLQLASTALLVGDAARAESIAREIPEQSPQHPEALLVRARALLELGDTGASLAAFQRAESERPESAALRIPRVAALIEERRFADARAALDEAYAAFEDEEPRALLRKVELVLLQYQAQEALQRLPEAQRELDEALAGVRALAARASDDVAPWQVLAELAIASGRLDAAEPALRDALAADPGRSGLYPLLAAVRVAGGDEAEGEALLTRALADGSADARISLAHFLSARDRRDEAIALLAEGLRERADDPLLLLAHSELLLDAGREPEAAAAVARFAALRDDAPQARLLEARLALLRGDAAGARLQLERLAPELDTSATQYWLARALEQSGDRVGAAHRMRLAAARDPSAPGPWLELLRLARERGDWRETAQAGLAAVQRAPRLIDGWEGVVDALIEQGQPAAALETARRAVQLLGEESASQLLLARALRASRSYAEALSALDAAAKLAGDTPEIAAERVLVLGLQGRLDAAAAEAARASAAHGDSALLHHALAAARFQAGQADAGSEEVERALALAPDDLRPLALRCQFTAATRRYEEAVRDCGRYLERHPDHAGLRFALGVAQEGAGEVAQAEASYRRAAELDPAAVAPRNNLALLLASRGELDLALAAAQEAYAQAAESPEVLDTLGWLYLEKGLTPRAVSLLEDAHRRAPELDAAQLHLALAYRKAGREAEARKLLDALRVRGASPDVQKELDAALATR